MENLMEAQEVCARLIIIYNSTIEQPVEIPIGHLQEDLQGLRRTADLAINRIETQNLSKKQKENWMNTKFQYVSWARDCLVLEENK